MKDQGLGDEIFFLRFAALLKKKGAWIAYQTDQKIKSLVEEIPFLDSVLTESDARPKNVESYSVSDVPYLLQIDNPDKFPPAVPLSIKKHRSDDIQKTLLEAGSGPYIGVTWRAGTQSESHPLEAKLAYREVDIHKLADTLRPLNATIVILQRNPDKGEISEFEATLDRKMLDLSNLNEDLEGMLALLSLLDDYIGVDNTNMHLSASISKPCRILVPHPPEWRMTAKGKQSVWFTGFNLYRQAIDGEWDAALEELSSDLIFSNSNH